MPWSRKRWRAPGWLVLRWMTPSTASVMESTMAFMDGVADYIFYLELER
jgi:hypothetical protein